MQIRECTAADVMLLAAMNKRLIEDEKSSNPMSIAELEDRMSGFLSGSYNAYLFEENKTAIGYALVDHSREPLYLRQFYIEREHRRKAYGVNAFRLLTEHLRTDRIDIDVLSHNEAGRAFWRKCGFSETCISMRYERRDNNG